MKSGVPIYIANEYRSKEKEYCVLIPIINEKGRIEKELKRAYDSRVYQFADIVICDGGSTDGCTDKEELQKFNVNTLLKASKVHS